MKIVLGIVIGVILGIIVLGIGLFFGITSLARSFNNQSAASVPSFTSPPPATKYSETVPSVSTPLPATPSTVAGLPSTAVKPAPVVVSFDLTITSYNIAGPTSATVNVQITNTGTSDAHHVWGKVEIYYQGSVIKLSGQDYLRIDAGTIKAGASLAAQAVLKVDLADGVKILANGGNFRLTIISDEKTQSYSYDFRP